MKGYKKIAAILLAAIMILAPTLIMAQNVTAQQRPNGDPLDIEVWTNKEEGGSFGQGENLVIYFRANRDCYVTIYDLDTKGDINLLYPYDYRDDNFVQGGVVYTIPDYYDDFVLRVNGPPGLEFVQAIASDRDFPVPDWSYNFRDPDGWREIRDERTALAYLEFINDKYFQADHCYFDCDLNYTYFEVRKNWQYSWDSYYYDDYSYYNDVNVYHYYHPYYYRPALYDPFWDPWDWCGTMYVGYPVGGAIYINGIFYGYAPLFIPRVSIGWCDVRIHYHDRDYYHDRIKIRRGLSHELYHEGGYKWKTNRKADYNDNVMAQKYYPKEKSISYRSSAKYTLGGRSGNVYKSDSKVTKGDRGTGTVYKPDGRTTKTRESVGTKTRESIGTKTRPNTAVTKDRSGSYSKTGKTTKERSKTTTSKGQTYTKEGTSNKGSKNSGSTGSKSGTYDKGTKSKSGSGSSGTKSTKTRKSATPSARFEKKGERTAYGSTDNSSRSGSSRSYGNSSSGSSGNSGSPGYKSSGTSRSKSGSSSTYGRGSSSTSKRSSGTYSKGSSSRSSGSKSSGSYKGSSSSRSSGKSSGSRSGSSKSSGGSRSTSKSRK